MLVEGAGIAVREHDAPSGVPGRADRTRSVLIVEAHERGLHAIVAAFGKTGLEVVTCTTVSSAEDACRERHFDLIVLGWLVERLFADELLERLQSIVLPRRLPPVAVLSCMTDATTRACLRPGTRIHGVLTKPLDPDYIANWAGAVLKEA